MLDIRTSDGQPDRIRLALNDLIKETKDVQVRNDKSLQDLGETVRNLAKKVEDFDTRTAKALDEAAKALSDAKGAPEIGVKFDELTAEMRSASAKLEGNFKQVNERMDAIEARGQRLAGGPGGVVTMESALAENKDKIESFMRDSTRDSRLRLQTPMLDGLSTRATTLPTLGDTQFGNLVIDQYRPGVVSFGYDPIGLWDIIPKMGAMNSDTIKAPRWTEKSDRGFVQTLVNGAVDGSPTPKTTVDVDSTAGMHAGAYVSFYTAASHTRLGRLRIKTVTSTTRLTFDTNAVDFDIADDDEVLFEGVATTAEGVAKPPGYMDSELLSASVQVIANYFKAAKNSVNTIPGLLATMQSKLRERNMLAREQHVLWGSGSSGTLNGFFNEASHSTDTWSTALDVGDNEADLISYSAMQIPSARPLFCVMSKYRWNSLVRRKADDGHYVLTSYGPMRIVDTPSMRAVGPVQVILNRYMNDTYPRNYALVLDRMASELYPQTGLAAFEMGYDGNDFTQNLITMLYEEAWAHLILDYTLFRGIYFDAAPAAV